MDGQDDGATPVASHEQALIDACGPVAGSRVVDVGCGEGALLAALARRGAEVTGVDPLMPQTGWQAGEAGGRWRLLRQGGERLPFADGEVDLVAYVFSLHHLPEALLPAALAEARRVLRPGGTLYVAEPLAEGPQHEATELFHDETAVRAAAAAALAAAAPLFATHRRSAYVDRRRYPDFATFSARAIAGRRFNGYEEAAVLAPAVRARFDAVHARTGGVFDQRVRVDRMTA